MENDEEIKTLEISHFNQDILKRYDEMKRRRKD